MLVNTNSLFSMSEANQNFSRIAREVDEKGTAVILKNNVPRYLIIDFSQAESAQAAENEDVMEISKRLIQKNRRHTRCLPSEKTEQAAGSHAPRAVNL